MIHQTEQEILRAIAEQYRARGYEVRSEVPLDAAYRADLVASKGDEHRVVELVGSGRKSDPAMVQALLDWRDLAPNRHIDVVLGAVARPLEIADRADVESRVAQSEELARSGSLEAALLVAWASFEAGVRSVVLEQRGSLVENADPVSSALHYGLVDPPLDTSLREVQRLRNAVAHGSFLPVRREDVAVLVEATRALWGAEATAQRPAVGQ